MATNRVRAACCVAAAPRVPATPPPMGHTGRPNPAILTAALAFLYVGHAALHPAPAQQDTAAGPDAGAILGQLTAGQTHDPVRSAQVTVSGTPFATTTDSSGLFTLAGIRPGIYVLEIRAVGYVTGTWRVPLKARQLLRHRFELDPLPVELPEVVVKGREPLALRRFADFERRRQAGMGYFLTQQQIERSHATTLIDVLVTVRGVQQVCLSNDCIAKMVRSPPGCYPQYFLDGTASTSYFARLTPPGDVRGVEIYRGSSETPAEFIGSSSACGVIAIWTKSSP
jgi:hypothetical protein